ncbi:MAG TPA: methyl-accepting chemotaxis protein [Cellulomonas sp.]
MVGIRARLIACAALLVALVAGLVAVGISGLHAVRGASGTAQTAAASAAERNLLVLLVVGIVAAIGIACWLTRIVVAPAREMVGLLARAAGGDLTGHASRTSHDEFGALADEYNKLVDALSAVLARISAEATGLSAATEELTVSATLIISSAGESSAQASVVAAAAEQVSTNVQTVAAATEEMSASIREIAKNTSDAAGVAVKAVHAAQAANATVSHLGASSAEIGNVIKVIKSIAAQTNLLALNATIEAARAGEAGKGFAVVAGEVKDLAQETSRATEDIGHKIDAIQSDALAAAAAIGQISGIIEQINDTQSTIASAVEEQTATTNEMSRNVSEAATGAGEIAANITGVAAAAAATSQGVSETLSSSSELSRMSTELADLVSRFRFSGREEEADLSVRAQITKAIGAHGAWKKRLSAALTNGTHQEDVATVARGDRCDFGRWLMAITPAGGDRAAHEASRTLHAAFHTEAAAVLRQISAGHLAQARESIDTGGRFAEASRLLTTTMIAWRKSTAGAQA